MRRLLLLFALLASASAFAQGGPQLYNSGFDTWSKIGGAWYPYSKNAPVSQRIWDTPNPGTSKLGINSTTPEYEHVAVPGPGKAAARIESRKLAWAFVAGNLYNGHFVRAVELQGVETVLGAPFTARPKSLKGYYHYIPKRINHAKAPMDNMEGRMDEGLIEVLFMDWDKPYTQISHKDGFLDAEKDPHIVGRAYLLLKKSTSGYVPFEIPVVYRNGKTPRYAVFTITPSRFGGFQTGASGSVLYVDEFSFAY
ncbi:MAG: PCMD domain-containing protein [Bacteroidales bacterium]|nr:PCMD domain-containing protein [Bacteroidales bacterium]